VTTGLEQILDHDTDAPALLIEAPAPSSMTDDRATKFRRHATRAAPHLWFLEPERAGARTGRLSPSAAQISGRS
jgi:hypothetical protein